MGGADGDEAIAAAECTDAVGGDVANPDQGLVVSGCGGVGCTTGMDRVAFGIDLKGQNCHWIEFRSKHTVDVG